MESAEKALNLFLEEDEEKAKQTAEELKELNDLRKTMTENGVKEALGQAFEYEAKGDKVLVSVSYTPLDVYKRQGLMYFLTIRPQKKKEEELKQMMETLEVGDSVLTTSGFYGVVVDKVDETTIIVEFGNDKHCRIPMEKSAIQAMEKANASSSEE